MLDFAARQSRRAVRLSEPTCGTTVIGSAWHVRRTDDSVAGREGRLHRSGVINALTSKAAEGTRNGNQK